MTQYILKKENWLNKNYNKLIEYSKDLEYDEWFTIISEFNPNIKSNKKLNDMVAAIMDSTSKHQAIELLNMYSIDQLTDILDVENVY